MSNPIPSFSAFCSSIIIAHIDSLDIKTKQVKLNPREKKDKYVTTTGRRRGAIGTSGWRSCRVSYISSSTNSFSGDFLLFAMASPKLRSMWTLVSVTSAKHFSRCGSSWDHISSHNFCSPANNSFTCWKTPKHNYD